MKTVSIIMPAHNAEKTIQMSIDSVLGQTFKDWELIIIDDGSCDGTAEIVKASAETDRRIILLTNESNSGVSQSRNRGMGYAKGKWLAFLDSDDLWHEQKLENQLRFIKETGAVISYTSTSYMTEEGKAYNYILQAEKKLSYKTLLKRNLMSCSSVMVKRDMMLSFPQGNLHEDYVVWLRIVRETGFAYGLDEPLLIYRKVSSSKSSKRIASAKMLYNAYRQAGCGMVGSGFLTLRYTIHSIGKRLGIQITLHQSLFNIPIY